MKTIIYAAQNVESTIDYSSHITQMLFTSGCNFRCSFCHNCALWEKQEDTIPEQELRDILTGAKKNWRDAVCITGGEPTIHPELPGIIDSIKQMGFLVKLDTNGTNPQMIGSLINTVDYFALDYKCSLQNYSTITRVDYDYSLITESLELIQSKARDYEVRTTIIPGIHDKKEMKTICREIRGVKKYIMQPFVPQPELLDNDYIRIKRTDRNELEKLRHYCENELSGSTVTIRM